MTPRLSRTFFERDPVTCARELIGCTLGWGDCAGVIVETEAYAGMEDEASHIWSRPSARAFVAANQPGAAYVYFNYGVHWMLNVLVKGGTADGFVLFRALEPVKGIAQMLERRLVARRKTGTTLANTALCSGPGKLAQALGVTGEDHGRDFCAGAAAAFYEPPASVEVVAAPRIGISRAQHLPWRFVLAGSPHISVRVPA